MKKHVLLHPSCLDEFKLLPKSVKDLFLSRFEILERDGFLRSPEGEKIEGRFNLYAARIRDENGNQWRGFYGYIEKDGIAFAVFMIKKTEKTDLKILKLAIKRLKDYE